MLKTSKVTKTIYNTNPTHSQPINLFTPSITSSSGSVCETEPSSISSSYRSNAGMNEDFNSIQSDESSIEKLKRELAAVRQAKSQLATLYKVSPFDCKRRTSCFSLARSNANPIWINPLKSLNFACNSNTNWAPSAGRIKRIWSAIYNGNCSSAINVSVNYPSTSNNWETRRIRTGKTEKSSRSKFCDSTIPIWWFQR